MNTTIILQVYYIMLPKSTCDIVIHERFSQLKKKKKNV